MVLPGDCRHPEDNSMSCRERPRNFCDIVVACHPRTRPFVGTSSLRVPWKAPCPFRGRWGQARLLVPTSSRPARILTHILGWELAICILWSLTATGLSQGTTLLIDPESPSGLDYYAQGGVVVDGVAYFTANDYSRRPGVKRSPNFPCVVAFDVRTFKKIRS